MNILGRYLSLGLILTLGCLLGMLGFCLWDKIPSPVERVAWSQEAQWISTPQPSYRMYARRTFYLPDTVQAGWLRLSADNNFILYLNGKQIARQLSIGSSSLGLASRLSTPSQDINDSQEYKVKSSNHHLSYLNNWKLTSYVDLTTYLRPGKNTIALEIQKARKNPRVLVEGAVYPVTTASSINLTTGATSWKVSMLSENRQNLQWFDQDFPDQSWSEAKVIDAEEKVTYSRLSQHLFDRFLQGSWITGNETPQGEVWLTSSWQVPQSWQRAFIRLAGDSDYALLINGLLVKGFGINKNNQLDMFEVTNFLKTGQNILAVHLARPLNLGYATLNSSLTPQNSLNFFLDGWVETEKKTITSEIVTDNTWISLNQATSGWAEGKSTGQAATILKSPNPQGFKREFGGNAYLLNYPDYLWHQSLWQIAGISCALSYTFALGAFWLGRQNSWWDSLGVGTGLLLPGTLFLIGIGLLKHRYAEAERALLFVQPHSNYLVLLVFIGIVVLTLLWSKTNSHHQENPNSSLTILPAWGLWFLLGLIGCVGFSIVTVGITFPSSLGLLVVCLGILVVAVLPLLSLQLRWNLQQQLAAIHTRFPAWGKWVFLILIVGVGFTLRIYDLDFTPRDSDENTSLDAVRGILRTGAPKATSGIWYTRGPAYHYLLALWLRLVGFSSFNARFLSVIFGTATLILVFIFIHKITGKVWLALVVTAILAIDPWEIMNSRNIRFYQNLQFFTLLTFWSFFQGFIYNKNRSVQYIFFIALTCTLQTQELSIMLLPYFLIIFLCFYRPFRLSGDWQILLCSLITFTIYIYNGIFFSIKTLTPLVALSNGTATPLRPHLSDLTSYTANLFVGNSRMYTLYSFFFILGFVYSLKRRDAKILSLFAAIFMVVISLTILVEVDSPRYAYYIYPIFIMLSVYSAGGILTSIGSRLEHILKNLLPLRIISIGFLSILLMVNIEPGRVLAAYKDVLSRDNNQIFEYIRTHRQEGDVVMGNLPAAAAISLGKLDYYLPSRGFVGFDGLYMRESRLIDRWAGGVAINNLDQMSHILEKVDRAWIQLDDNQPPKDKQLLEIYKYTRNLGQPIIETYGVKLRLWKREDGIFTRIPIQGKDLGLY
ncbi:MAG: glycosyltransferase family 39 protein [Nostoc sp.]|uniref:glycosyltransferase family 39 protein n=1 Tax=Nostoc sp. TaxID=1180 RepID=UPI002FF789A9